MPLKIFPRQNGVYYIRGTYKGVSVYQSTQTRDRALALEELVAVQTRIQTEAIHGPAVTKTFAEAALEYMEAGHSRRFLAPLIKHFGETPILKIDREAKERAARLLYPDASEATRRRQALVPTNAVISLAMGTRPKPRPKENKRVRWLRLEEVDHLLEHAPRQDNRVMVSMFVECGPRLRDMLTLSAENLELEHCRGWVHQKQGDWRMIEFGIRTRREIEKLPRRTGPILRTPKGQPYSIPKEGTGSNPIKRALDRMKAGSSMGDDVTAHVFRHTWASWAYACRQDPYLIGDKGGWSTGEMPRRYVKLCPPGYGARIQVAGWMPLGLSYATPEQILEFDLDPKELAAQNTW